MNKIRTNAEPLVYLNVSGIMKYVRKSGPNTPFIALNGFRLEYSCRIRYQQEPSIYIFPVLFQHPIDIYVCIFMRSVMKGFFIFQRLESRAETYSSIYPHHFPRNKTFNQYLHFETNNGNSSSIQLFKLQTRFIFVQIKLEFVVISMYKMIKTGSFIV